MVLLDWSKMLMRWALERERTEGQVALYLCASALVLPPMASGSLIFVLADYFELTKGIPAVFVFLSVVLIGSVFGIPAFLSLLLVNTSSGKLRSAIETWSGYRANDG